MTLNSIEHPDVTSELELAERMLQISLALSEHDIALPKLCELQWLLHISGRNLPFEAQLAFVVDQSMNVQLKEFMA